MRRRLPCTTLTGTLLPYTTLVRSLRQAAGCGGGKLRVTGAGELVRPQQVFGGRRGRQQDCQGEREGEGAAAHARFLWIKRRRPARAPRRRGKIGRAHV